MSIKIDPQFKARWLDRLHAPDIHQARCVLTDAVDCYNNNQPQHTGFCCLGHAAIAQGGKVELIFRDAYDTVEDDEGDVELADAYSLEVPGFGGVDDSDILNQRYADTLGLTKEHQAFFSSLNDGQNFRVHSAGRVFKGPIYSGPDVMHDDGTWLEMLLKIADGKKIVYHGDEDGKDVHRFAFGEHTLLEIAAIIREHF